MRLWPLPRAVQLSLVLLLALASVAPTTLAAPLVPDVVYGAAAATTFQFFGGGRAIEGGAFDWTYACSNCWIRATITSPGLHVVDGTSPALDLTPGQYELREYRGTIGLYEFGLHNYQVWIEGTGKFIKLS